MKTLKRILGIILGIVAFVSFIYMAGESTGECAHPFLTQIEAIGLLIVDAILIRKIWPEIWEEKYQ